VGVVKGDVHEEGRAIGGMPIDVGDGCVRKSRARIFTNDLWGCLIFYEGIPHIEVFRVPAIPDPQVRCQRVVVLPPTQKAIAVVEATV